MTRTIRQRPSRTSTLGRKRTLALATTALTLCLAPQAAYAQFAGNPVVDRGTVFDPNTGTAPTSASNVFVVGSDFAQITWTPTGNSGGGATVDFLPEQNAVAFWDGGRFGDFTVLNRVLNTGTGPIAFNGSVSSFVGDAIGGTVWFYSPTGILVGPNAFMDVGNLLLSTGALSQGDNGAVTISRATAGIENRGLLDADGYVALVAPRIVQSGDVQAGRTVAYVAAESAQLTLRENLFSVEVTVAAPGGADPMIEHLGTTQARSAAATDTGPHQIAFVAVSRNDALGILLGGTVQASSAAADGNAVVLSAGRDLAAGVPTPTGASGIAAGTATDIRIEAGDFPHLVRGGSFVADATGAIVLGTGASVQASRSVRLDAGGAIALGTDGNVQAADAVEFTAGEAISIGDDANVQAGGALAFAAGTDITTGGGSNVESRGSASLSADGSIAIGADARLAAREALAITSGGAASFADRATTSAGGSLALDAGGAVTTGTSASLEAGGAALVTSGGDVALGEGSSLGSGSDLTVTAEGAITLGQGATTAATAASRLTAGEAIALANGATVDSGGPTTLTAGEAIALATGAAIESASSLSLDAGSDITLGSNADLTATGPVSLAAGSNVALLGGAAIEAGGAVSIDAGGNLAIGPSAIITSSGPATLDAGGAIALGTDSDVSSQTSLTLTAGESIDLAAGSSARSGTTLALDAGDSVSLAAGGELVGGSGLTIDAARNVAISGAVRLSGSGGTVAVTAGNRIDVFAPTGSIALRGQDGGLFGTLSLAAPDIVVADAATRTALGTATTPAQRLAALIDNRGTEAAGGVIAADSVTLTGSRTIFVQNTGTSAAFAGVNANTLAIRASGTSTPDVQVFGRSNGTGGAVVSDNSLREFVVDRLYPFVPGSQVNSCLLSAPSCNPVEPPAPEIIFDPVDNPVFVPSTTPTISIQLNEVGELDPRDLGLLDDPVTGSGNVAEWNDACVEEDRSKCP